MWLYLILTDLNRFSVWLADVGACFEYLELKHTRERKKEKERKTETEGLKDDSLEKKNENHRNRERDKGYQVQTAVHFCIHTLIMSVGWWYFGQKVPRHMKTFNRQYK